MYNIILQLLLLVVIISSTFHPKQSFLLLEESEAQLCHAQNVSCNDKRE